jgi:hypothetical protein
MRGFTAVASRRALSAGTLLIFGGGLFLYQMTSLWLGPAGSREFHLSLTIPVIEDEFSEPTTSDVSLALGTLVVPDDAGSLAAPVPDRPSVAAGAHRRHVPASAPVASQPPATHPSAHPAPPTIVPKGDEAD